MILESHIKRPLFLTSLHQLLAMVLLLSLVAGKTFTKFALLPNVYLHDLLLLFICFLALNNGRVAFRNPEVLLLILLSLGYLFFSLYFYRGLPEFQPKMALRQYSIFLYLALGYFLFNAIYRSREAVEQLTAFFILVGKISVVLTWAKIILIERILHSDERFDFRFYSYIAVFGVITYSAYVLVYKKSKLRYLLFLSCLVLTIFTKQAAFFLAVFMVGIAYFFVRVKVTHRFAYLLIGMAGIALLFFAPDFTDVNVKWRLLYWKYVLKNAIYKNYLIKGNGFGLPYMSVDYTYYLKAALKSNILTPEYDPTARYVTPPHNSFITFIAHIGLLPFFLLLYPIRGLLRVLLQEPYHNDKIKYLLTLTLIGSIIWCCFNVILELPHSAVYFWMIYFATAYYLNNVRYTDAAVANP